MKYGTISLLIENQAAFRFVFLLLLFVCFTANNNAAIHILCHIPFIPNWCFVSDGHIPRDFFIFLSRKPLTKMKTLDIANGSVEKA